jgi:hypothetical protein
VDGNLKGGELSAEYIESLRGDCDVGSGIMAGIVKTMPWEAFGDKKSKTDEQTYQKGIIVGFFAMIERFLEVSTHYADPAQALAQSRAFHEMVKAEL